MESEHDSEALTDWEHIQSPTHSSLTVEEEFFGESPAFLPENHEDLHLTSPQENNQEGPETTNLQLSSSCDNYRQRRKKLHLGSLLCGWFSWIARGVLRKGFWLLALTTGGVAAVVLASLFHRRVWKSKLQLNRSKEGLMLLIKDKEKRINELLLQIAQMNEVLQERRRVPVLRVK